MTPTEVRAQSAAYRAEAAIYREKGDVRPAETLEELANRLDSQLAHELAKERKAALEARMTDLVGKPVTLTIRGERAFTFSTDDVTPDLDAIVGGFFGDLARVTVDHDDECGTCAYVDV